jgi:hypothetical protein
MLLMINKPLHSWVLFIYIMVDLSHIYKYIFINKYMYAYISIYVLNVLLTLWLASPNSSYIYKYMNVYTNNETYINMYIFVFLTLWLALASFTYTHIYINKYVYAHIYISGYVLNVFLTLWLASPNSSAADAICLLY